MSVTYRAFGSGSVESFFHLPSEERFSPTSFILREDSTHSKMVFGANYRGLEITAELFGPFSGVYPAGTPVLRMLPDMNGGLITQTNTYINNEWIENVVYSPSILAVDLFNADSDATLISFNKIYAGNDIFIGSTAPDNSSDDQVNGYGGNDTFYGFGDGGSDLFDGGVGVDTAIYRGNLAGYILEDAAGFWNPSTDSNDLLGLRVIDINGLDGVDQLVNVERLAFADTMLALDTAANENAGNAYLLYQAAFDRTPDVEGLGYWISKVDNGANVVREVALNFILSDEFISLYGANPTVPEFMDLLYQNVLNRSPDQDGLNYWLNEFNRDGDSLVYRAGILNNFAISAENIANVADQIVDGIQYQAYVG